MMGYDGDRKSGDKPDKRHTVAIYKVVPPIRNGWLNFH